MDEDQLADDNSIRGKWMMDGARTLSEAAAMLRERADWLTDRENEGWQLNQPIEDDYGFLRKEE